MSKFEHFGQNPGALHIDFVEGNAGGPVGPDIDGVIGIVSPKSAYVLGVPLGNELQISGSPDYLVGTTLAPFTTIASAIAQAVTDGASTSVLKIIHVRPGTYTENFNLPAGVVLIGLDQNAAQKGFTTTSTFEIPSVTIAGTITFTGSNSKLANLRILSPSGVQAFNIGGAYNLQLYNVIALVDSINCFNITAGTINLLCQGCTFKSLPGSLGASLYNGTNNVVANIILNDCSVFFEEGSSRIAANLSFYNSDVQCAFDFSISTTACTVNVYNSQFYVLDTSILLSSTGSDVDIIAYNSRMTTGGNNLFSITTGGSSLTCYNCTINAAIQFTGAAATSNNIELHDTRQLLSGVEILWNKSLASSAQISTQNTGTTFAANEVIVEAGGGDAFFRAGIRGAKGWCIGFDNSDADRVREVYSASSSTIDPSTGTLISVFDTATAIRTMSVQNIGPFGVATQTVSTSPIVIASTTSFVLCDTSAIAINVQLPATPAVGTQFTVKDFAGNASVNPITVSAVGVASTFDGSVDSTMITNYAVKTYTYTGSNKYVVS